MRSGTQVLIAFFSAMAVTMVAVTETRRKSPGALASVHGREEELAGPRDCAECHGGLFGTLRGACLDCHAPIAAQLDGASGLHGTLGPRADQCGTCHAEHHGESAPLVHARSFVLAGARGLEEFDHGLIGFVLDGAHDPLDCTACHANARVPVLPRGATRFLGLDRDCASCHEDAHEGRMAAACASCHGQATWDGLAALGHERVLPLVGGHGDLECAACHAPDGPRSLEVVGGRGERPPARDCVACHDSPHRAEFVAAATTLAGLAPGSGCVACHAPDHVLFREPVLAEMSAEKHAASGFPLVEPHDAVACAECHAPELADFAARYPGRSAERCSACHADVHAGQFDTGPFAGQECTACHAETHFEPHAFTAELHARSALELSGRHLAIECSECHARPDRESPRRFRGTPALCDDCHADAHDGFFAGLAAASVPPAHGECERCHGAASFADAAAGFDHTAFTGFAVVGAHAEGPCTACHRPSRQPDAAGRTFGRVRVQFGSAPASGTGSGCAVCHADPHGGRFDPEVGVPAEVDGRTDCARCHVESSFRELPHGFEHEEWTGFALAGPHASAGCGACHAPIPLATRGGRSSSVAAGERCSDCHEDPHAGQFAGSDCDRCHDPSRADLVAFDHERDARFALGEAHRGIECAACHPTTLQSGFAAVHYRPIRHECVDCHGTTADDLLRRPRRR